MAKVTVDEVKKVTTETAEKVSKTAEKAEATVKAAAEKAEPVVKETAAKAKATVEKATKTAAKATKSAEKAVKKAKKEVVETAYVQFQGNEYNVEDIIAKAKAAFKAENKTKAISEITVYIKPEEYKAYYVVNGSNAGSVEL